MGYLISIDGLDGCGKTTLGKRLAEKIGGTYYYTPPSQIHSIRELADNSIPIIRYYYYMMGNLIASRDFEKMFESRHVVSDRYFYATQAFHEPLDIRLPIPEELLLPDVVVYVSASWDTIRRRLKERLIETPYEEIGYLEKVAKHYEIILENVKNVIKVDSTDREPDDVVDEIIFKLKSLELGF